MTNNVVVSIDAEMFTDTPAYRAAAGSVARDDVGIDGLEYLLDAFDGANVTATFFVVSSLAERFPALVQRIAESGHEVASHSHSHRLLTDLEESAWQDEISKSKSVLESIVGARVDGFRAPAFDTPDGFFRCLEDNGYRYDSSVVPARRILGWYGGDFTETGVVPASEIASFTDSVLMELPVSVMPGLRLPLSGAWIRFFGSRYTRTGIRWLQSRSVTPVLYFHPWEFVDLPRVEGVPSRVYVRTGSWMRRAVESILDGSYEFVEARECSNRD